MDNVKNDSDLFRLVAAHKAADAAFEALPEDQKHLTNHPLLIALSEAEIRIVQARPNTLDGLEAKLPFVQRFFSEQDAPEVFDQFMIGLFTFVCRQRTAAASKKKKKRR